MHDRIQENILKKTVLFQLPDTRHAINLNVLHDVLMVMVRIARYEAKVAERLTTQTCHSGLNVFQKVKHLHSHMLVWNISLKKVFFSDFIYIFVKLLMIEK